MEKSVAARLIRKGVEYRSQSCWADLGCGAGVFTSALASLLHNGSTIYAVDKDASALSKIPLQREVSIIKRHMDFAIDPMDFPPLDGILMANALHYIKSKDAFIRKLLPTLNQKSGRMLIVEYETATATKWIPYPVNYNTLHDIFSGFGFSVTKLELQPSVFSGLQFYSALVLL